MIQNRISGRAGPGALEPGAAGAGAEAGAGPKRVGLGRVAPRLMLCGDKKLIIKIINTIPPSNAKNKK